MSTHEGPRLELSVQRVARALKGELVVAGARRMRSVSIDSRTLAPEALFVPLAGSRVDGHAFLGQALERGAAGVLARRSLWSELSGPIARAARGADASVVLVDDTLAALQELGRRHLRERPRALRIGVTGSSGKTTTKEILAAVLSREAPTAASRGNLNSEIGLPLSCFEVTPEHRFAVFEMGINHPGEMDLLADIARPDLAVVTNVGTAHVGLLGSREAIAREKIRIAGYFDGRQSVFLYEDDPFYDTMAGSVNGKVVPFGPRSTRGFEGSQDLGLDGTVVHWEGLRIRFPLFGAFNLLNALAALSVSAELGVDKSKIKEALESIEPLFGRSQVFRGAVTVIHDSYNANPDAVERLFEFVEGLPWAGRKLVVLGSMKELGESAEEAHRAVGRRASRSGVDALLLFGEEMRWALEELEEAGRGAVAFWTTAYEELQRNMEQTVGKGDLVVLKGSRAMELERLLTCLPVETGRGAGAGVGVESWS